MLRDDAESVALQALVWLLAQDGMSEAFLDQSGLSQDELRSWDHAGDPGARPSFIARR